MLFLVRLAAPSFPVLGVDVGPVIPVLGSVVQWASLVASIVAIGYTARAAKRARLRDLKEQVSAVFLRTIDRRDDTGDPLFQAKVVNQSTHSIWDVLIRIEPKGAEPRYHLLDLGESLDVSGEIEADVRASHTARGSKTQLAAISLILTDYQGRVWERGLDNLNESEWALSKVDARAEHARLTS